MQGKFDRMTMGDGAEIAVYHVQPGGERRGGLIVVQEIFGVTEHIREVADGYAAEGYEVLAPALFDREQPGFEAGYTGPDLQRAIELARQLHPFEQSLADVQTCIDVLQPKGSVFAVGYCYGGSVAWFAATRMTGVAAASSYYGSQVPLTDEVPRIPVVAHFGRYDTGIPLEGVEALIARHPAHADIHLYDAGHGFSSDRRKDYHEASAELARERTLALFRANGG
ncbi:dienelactone hydrolase family protein [uncultured Sphingomonas sp.]|uniref:dienelactone hydrolase family protein n=1 Tax=uncultured Sphingomonas sp. TaxID=158754 RepID=UPI0035CAC285